MTTVYLAGPHMADDYRARATPWLVERGYAVLDPMRPERDFRGREQEPDIEHEIVRGDLLDVASCDVILANFAANSVGTSMECWYGFSIGRPVVAFFEDGRWSPWAVYVARGRCFDPLEAALEHLAREFPAS